MKQNSFYKKILLLTLFLLCLTPIIWFINRKGIILNGSDTNFPLNPLIWIGRRFFVWDSFSNAGQNFAAGISGLFFHLIQLIPYLLKFNLQVVQIVSLVFWFSLVVLSSYSLSKLMFKNNYFSQIVFVILYSFNIYLFNTWEVAKVTNLSLMVAIPFALSILIRLDEGSLKYPLAIFYSFMTGLILSGSGINPSYFICFFIVLFIFFLFQYISDHNNVRLVNLCKIYLVVILPIIIINLFWIIPTLIFIQGSIGAQGSINQIGYTNWIDSLSQHTSIFNVARLQGAWDWYSFDDTLGMPMYIPYAINYFKNFPFIVFSLLGYGLSVISLILKSNNPQENKYKIIFSVLLILGLFLGAGTNAPTGVFYSWLIRHIPFFTLFRSPWYIFTPLTVLAFSGLVAFFVHGIRNRKVVVLLTLIIGVGNLIYCYPLITGKIFRPLMRDNFYIKFPKYVMDSFDYVNKLKLNGRIVGYPGDEIERFIWGYNGIDSILGLGTNKELLYSTLNPDSFQVSGLISDFYNSLTKGEMVLARNIASKLNLSMIFKKDDQSTLAFDLNDEVKKYSNSNFGKWTFYKLPEENQTKKIFIAKSYYFVHPYDGNQKASGLINKNSVTLRGGDNMIKDISPIQSLANFIVIAENKQNQDYGNFINSLSNLEDRITFRNMDIIKYSFMIDSDGEYFPVLERFQVEEFGINPSSNITVELDGSVHELKYTCSDDSFIYYEPLSLKEGGHYLSINVKNINLIDGGDFETRSLVNFVGNDSSTIFQDVEGNHFLKTVNMGHEIDPPGVVFKINRFDPRMNYLVQFRYRQIYGSVTAVGINQFRDSGMIKSYFEKLPAIPDWQDYSFYFTPVVTLSDSEIKLIAPIASKDFGIIVSYDDLAVYKVFSNNLYFLKNNNITLDNPDVIFDKKSPVKYTGVVTNSNPPHLLVFSENYSPYWELKIFDRNGKKINMTIPHFSVNYYANGWYIDRLMEDYSFEITYKLQKYMILGAAISLSSLILLGGYALNRKLKIRKH